MILKIRDLIDILSVTEMLLLSELIVTDLSLSLNENGISITGRKELRVSKGSTLIEFDNGNYIGLINPFTIVELPQDNTTNYNRSLYRDYLSITSIETSTSKMFILKDIVPSQFYSECTMTKINDKLYSLVTKIKGITLERSSYLHDIDDHLILTDVISSRRIVSATSVRDSMHCSVSNGEIDVYASSMYDEERPYLLKGIEIHLSLLKI